MGGGGGFFPRTYNYQIARLTTHLDVLSKLRMIRVIPSLPHKPYGVHKDKFHLLSCSLFSKVLDEIHSFCQVNIEFQELILFCHS